MVTKKLQNLQYTHEREIEKERNIVSLLQQNLKEQKDAFVKQMAERQAEMESFTMRNQRSSEHSEKDTEIAQLKAQLHSMSQLNRQMVAENEKLKKSKNNLEQQIIVLSDQIVQMSM